MEGTQQGAQSCRKCLQVPRTTFLRSRTQQGSAPPSQSSRFLGTPDTPQSGHLCPGHKLPQCTHRQTHSLLPSKYAAGPRTERERVCVCVCVCVRVCVCVYRQSRVHPCTQPCVRTQNTHPFPRVHIILPTNTPTPCCPPLLPVVGTHTHTHTHTPNQHWPWPCQSCSLPISAASLLAPHQRHQRKGQSLRKGPHPLGAPTPQFWSSYQTIALLRGRGVKPHPSSHPPTSAVIPHKSTPPYQLEDEFLDPRTTP